jgi:hypothetical protein
VERSESVAPVDFASKSKDLQVCQRTMLDETLDAFRLHALSKRAGEHYTRHGPASVRQIGSVEGKEPKFLDGQFRGRAAGENALCSR